MKNTLSFILVNHFSKYSHLIIYFMLYFTHNMHNSVSFFTLEKHKNKKKQNKTEDE